MKILQTFGLGIYRGSFSNFFLAPRQTRTRKTYPFRKEFSLYQLVLLRISMLCLPVGIQKTFLLCNTKVLVDCSASFKTYSWLSRLASALFCIR